MRNFTILLFALFYINMLSSYAQLDKSKKNNSNFKKAVEYFHAGDNKKATIVLDKILKIDSTYVNAYILKGDINIKEKNSKKAIEYFKKAIFYNPKQDAMLIYSLATEELAIGQYDSALVNFNKFLQYKQNDLYKNEAEKSIETCIFAREAIKNPVSFTPINMGENINSEFDEYFATMPVDEKELIFTVRHPREDIENLYLGREIEDFYCSYNENGIWQKRTKILYPLNSKYNEGAQSISADGRYLFFTICDNSDADNIGYGRCDLYWSKKIDGKWSAPKNCGKTVNSPYIETQPSIAPDGHTVYFSSNRPGGYGGMDIWKTTMIEEGIFTSPVNLGNTVNTKYDDISPFIHADNKTLYFSSDGFPGMGGKDLYYTHLVDSNQWTPPKNLGYPINTPADEINLFINASGNIAYFASNQSNGYGGLDIYYFEIDSFIRPTPVTYIKGKVLDALTKEPLKANIEIIALDKNIVAASTTSDPKTGAYLISIVTGSNLLFNVTSSSYSIYSDNYKITDHSKTGPIIKDILMNKNSEGTVFVLKNIFFEFNDSKLLPESSIELNKLIEYLTINKNINIEIGGHTDNQGTVAYNVNLSVERAKSVYQYLVNHGISEERLAYKGYGMEHPVATNNTEEGRAANRRTELTITKK